jgi:hypothetical protein
MGRRLKPYLPDGEVLTRFFWDRSPVSIIQGPIGSGTSTACCHKLWAISREQEAGTDGVRRTKWLVVRNTYDELKRTTLATWKLWFETLVGGKFGEVQMTRPFVHHIKVPHPDGKTLVDCEVTFLALDVEEDVRRLMSFEGTGIFFNEMQFTWKKVFDEAESRVRQGRYPPAVLGVPPTWKGVIGDLNAPTEGHWIPYMRGDVPLPAEMTDEERIEFRKPEGWSFFVQPAGLLEIVEERGGVRTVVGYKANPKAENQRWLAEPYLEVIKGKPKPWIDARVMNRVALYTPGKAVHEGFLPETHVAREPIAFNPDLPLYVGIDFARNPAAVFGQVLRGQLIVIGEWGVENKSAPVYAPMFKQALRRLAPETPLGVKMFGDPTGDARGQGTDTTPYRVFEANGMSVVKSPGGNSVSLRRSAVDGVLAGMVHGAPMFILSPSCPNLKFALGGGYHFKKVQGANRYHDDPEKDRSADFADALQYLCLGAGFGRAVVEQPEGLRRSKEGVRTRRKFSLRHRREQGR